MTSKTLSEQRLAKLAENSFLSLWSYPNPFRDQNGSSRIDPPKEICDLLVVCGKNVIVFSDKECKYRSSGNTLVDWKRWRSRAIIKSAKQVDGAIRWLKNFPNRVYADEKCSTRILPKIHEDSSFFRIVVAGGAREQCKKYFNSESGSLVQHAGAKNDQSKAKLNNQAFTVDLSGLGRGFTHCFDEHTLGIILGEFDTIADFIGYLNIKEYLAKSLNLLAYESEEDFVAFVSQLRRISGDLNESVCLSATKYWVDRAEGLYLQEGFRRKEVKSEEYKNWHNNIRISRYWDNLIQEYIHYAKHGLLVDDDENDLSSYENALRSLVLESRANRIELSVAFLNNLVREEGRQIYSRTILKEDGYGYVFIAFPLFYEGVLIDPAERMAWLISYCCAALKKFDHLTYVVGIASEHGGTISKRTNDLFYISRDGLDSAFDEVVDPMIEENAMLSSSTLRAQEITREPSQYAKKNRHQQSKKRYKLRKKKSR